MLKLETTQKNNMRPMNTGSGKGLEKEFNAKNG